MKQMSFTDYQGEHFLWQLKDGIGQLTLNRPDRKNPLTFDSYGEMRDLFRDLAYATDVHAVVIENKKLSGFDLPDKIRADGL